MRITLGLLTFAILGCSSDKPAEPPPVAKQEPAPPPTKPVESEQVAGPQAPPADDAPIAGPAAPGPKDKAALDKARAAGILGSKALTQGGAFASLTGKGDINSGFDDSNIYGGLLGNDAGDMNGGFGYGKSGFGPGGGGTGWGSIGTGRYGTLGHGSGTGSGYGVGGGRGGMRGRSAAVPTVSLGQPTAQGDLDKAIIRRYIKRNIQKLQYCYEKQLLVKPTLAGTVVVQFTIEATGSVTSAAGAGVDPEVSSCVASVVKGIEFPKPKNASAVIVSYPMTFRPAGG